jgi:predicted HTH domain antitoxin
MSLVISDNLLRASGFLENELFLEIVLMLFRQDKIRINHSEFIQIVRG